VPGARTYQLKSLEARCTGADASWTHATLWLASPAPRTVASVIRGTGTQQSCVDGSNKHTTKVHTYLHEAVPAVRTHTPRVRNVQISAGCTRTSRASHRYTTDHNAHARPSPSHAVSVLSGQSSIAGHPPDPMRTQSSRVPSVSRPSARRYLRSGPFLPSPYATKLFFASQAFS